MSACAEMAAFLGIPPETVFWFDRGNRKPVIAVWVTGARIAIDRAEVKKLANRHGAKFYLSKLHPHEQEKRERARRKKRNYVTAEGRAYRLAAWQRQKGRCMWCRAAVPATSATLEHIVPKRDGGRLEPTNLGMACGPCNWHRDRTPRILAFLLLLRYRLQFSRVVAG